MSGIQLIVGLGNPGKEYAQTRHNAGVWFVEELVREAQTSLRSENKFHGLYASTKLQQQAVQFLLPTTFMNLSGQAVRACMSYQKIAPSQLLVVHDDLDLPVGSVKLKYDGGDGGHNGVKDIIRHLNSKQFYRLRIGVSRPQDNDVIDYVLEAPSKTEREQINGAIQQALTIVPLLLQGEIAQAMQNLHTQ